MANWMVNFLVGMIMLGASAASASEPRSTSKSAEANAGRAIYEQSCASCHGARGEGAPRWQRPDRNGEMPAPPHDSTGHTWKHSDAMLFRLVKRGWRDPFNKTQRLTMPAFGGQLSREQTIAVIAYLKTQWKPAQRRFQAEESRGQPFPPPSP